MNTTLRTTAFTLTALLCCTTALRAEVTQQSIVDSLTASGYTATEISFGTNTVRGEATNGTSRIEVVYDRTTGQVLSQETSGRDGSGSGLDDPAGDDAGDDNGSDDSDSDHGGSDSDHDGGSDSDD